MEKIEYRYRIWYRYRPKFMVSDWYRIETKKAGIAHHYNEGQSLLRKYINTANALLIDLLYSIHNFISPTADCYLCDLNWCANKLPRSTN